MTPISQDLLNNSGDLSKDYFYVKEGVCHVKKQPDKCFFRGQNSDLHETYQFLLNLKDIQLQSLSSQQLKNAAHFVTAVKNKVLKSKKPAGLYVTVYNLFAQCFNWKKIETYDYTEKLNGVWLRINALQQQKEVAYSASFGKEAFKLQGISEDPKFSISDEEIFTLTEKDEFKVLYRDGVTLVNKFIRSTANTGFSLIVDPVDKERSKIKTRFILFMISDSSPLSQERKGKAKEKLIDGFKHCQADQYTIVDDLYNELCSANTLESRFKIAWQKLKERAFDAWIIERHPSTQADYAPTTEQFPHVKNAYLELFATQLGLAGRELAINDRNRPKGVLKGEDAETLISQFKSKINLKDFIFDLCLSINDPKPSIAGELVTKWGSMIKEDTFGYYMEGKQYESLPKPNESQENYEIPYISPAEVVSVLKEGKIV